MTLLFTDGFDHYSSSNTSQMWTFVNGTSVTSTNARNGTGNALFMNDLNHYVYYNLANATTFVIGGAWRFSDLNSTNTGNNFLALQDTGTNQVFLRATSQGAIEVRSGSTLLGTSAIGVITAASYYYIEFKGTISTSISSNTCKVQVNGVEVINLSAGVSTRNTANTFYNRIVFSTNGPSAYLDDVYICDQSGSINNDFLGDVRVITLLPDGDGDSSQWTNSAGTSISNYTYVDETSPNDDTDYVRANNVNLLDLYSMGTLTGVNTILAVQQCAYARKDAAGTRKLQIAQKVGSNNFTSSSITLPDSYRYYTQVLEVNPDTTTAWTASTINAAQFGVKTVT